jgi:hypothetical protein
MLMGTKSTYDRYQLHSKEEMREATSSKKIGLCESMPPVPANLSCMNVTTNTWRQIEKKASSGLYWVR